MTGASLILNKKEQTRTLKEARLKKLENYNAPLKVLKFKKNSARLYSPEDTPMVSFDQKDTSNNTQESVSTVSEEESVTPTPTGKQEANQEALMTQLNSKINMAVHGGNVNTHRRSRKYDLYLGKRR